jgi:hypothetical protein
MSTNVNYASSAARVTFPSDNLRPLYELCKKYPQLDEIFGMLPQFRFVIDTNSAIRELLFVTKSRRNPLARSSLREVMDSGLVVTIAPARIKEEVSRNIPRLAQEEDVAKEKLDQAWQEFQGRIEFSEDIESAIPANVAHLNDLPFVNLYLTSDADAVLTQDKHISMMGAKALAPDKLVSVRDYARSKSPEVTLRVGGVLVVGVSIGSVIALLKIIAAALRSFAKLPVEFQVLIIAGAIFAFVHPGSRRALSNSLSVIASSLKIPADIFVEVFAELIVKFGEAQLELKAKQTIVENTIPRRSLSTLPSKSISDEKIEERSHSSEGTSWLPALPVMNVGPAVTQVRKTPARSKRNPKRRTQRRPSASKESQAT